MVGTVISLLYAPLCVLLAWFNSRLIKKGIPIKHLWNGLLHVSAAILIGWFFTWNYGLAILFIARVVFDTSLNLFRGLSIDYVSPAPKSIVDKAEKRIFGENGYLPKILYVLIIIVCLLT